MNDDGQARRAGSGRRSHVVIVNWKDGRHPEAGGAEVFCEAVAREMVSLGFRVTFLVSRPQGQPARSDVDGYRVRRMGSTYTVYLFALLWLLRHRRGIDAVIDSQNGIPFFTPLALRRTTSVALLIHHVHQDQFAMYFPPLMARVGRWLESTGSRLVYKDRAVCAVSPSSRREIRKQLGLAGAIYVVPNGSAPPSPSAEHRRASVPTITCVGRLVPHKRWELLVGLTAQLRAEVPDLRVELVGTGSEEGMLRRLVEQHGVGDIMTVHGFVSVEERDRLLATAWLTVSTSVGEGWGLSMIEAAALGVPAVALDVPGLRDSIRDGLTGWISADGDLVPTVAGALKALGDQARADEFAERCRSWADSLQWSATAERFHAVFVEEATRLGSAEQRQLRSTDIGTVVTLDHAAAASLNLSALRATDQTTFCGTCLNEHDGPWRLLLHGRDERDALAFLIGHGVEPGEDHVQLDLCRPHQLLTWHDGGAGHSYLSTHRGLRCPTRTRRTDSRPVVQGQAR